MNRWVWLLGVVFTTLLEEALGLSKVKVHSNWRNSCLMGHKFCYYYHRDNLFCLLFILPDPCPPTAHMHPSHQPHPPQVGHAPHFTGHPYGLCSYSPDFMFYPLQSDQYDLHTCGIDKLLSVTMYMEVGKFPKSHIL